MSISMFWFTSPLPEDLESAHEEIVRLRGQLNHQNKARAEEAVKAELMKRSLVGQILRLQKKLDNCSK